MSVETPPELLPQKSTWHFRDFWTEPPHGHGSLPKAISITGVFALTSALIIAVRNRDVSFDLLVGYSIAVTLLASPTIGIKLIGLKWGKPINGDVNGTTPAKVGG